MIFKQIEYKDSNSKFDYEEIPQEDLWEDGELDSEQVKEKLYQEVIRQGAWKVIRNITKGEINDNK